jgi:hypothetical protein
MGILGAVVFINFCMEREWSALLDSFTSSGAARSWMGRHGSYYSTQSQFMKSIGFGILWRSRRYSDLYPFQNL